MSSIKGAGEASPSASAQRGNLTLSVLPAQQLHNKAIVTFLILTFFNKHPQAGKILTTSCELIYDLRTHDFALFLSRASRVARSLFANPSPLINHVGEEGKDQEYLRGKIFDAADYNRTITCRGTLIMIYDPKAAKGTPPYWEYEVPTQNTEHEVPAGYNIKVIDAWVLLTKSARA